MTDISNDISFVGQVDLKTADIIAFSGKRLNIASMLAELVIHEDILSNTLSGYMLLEDSLDLISNLPLIGQETFEVEFQTPTLTSKIKKTFYIYKLQHRGAKKRVQTYMLNFCSVELVNSINSKVAKSFSGVISDIVVSIFNDPRYLKSETKIVVEKTQNSQKFIAPYWSPIETINWLTSKSLNKRGTPNYLFFENNQSFEYSSIETLMMAKPKREYVYADVDPATAYGASGDKELKYSIVESITTPTTFDYLRNTDAGMFGSTLYTMDMTTKHISVNNFDYINDFDKVKHLNKYPIRTPELNRKSTASVYFIEKNSLLYGSNKDQQYNKLFIQRNSLLEQITASKIILKVPGRTDIKAGDTVNFKMNEFRQILVDEIDTKATSDFYTGKYLVTAIRHQIISGKHNMFMEIISDSMKTKLSTIL